LLKRRKNRKLSRESKTTADGAGIICPDRGSRKKERKNHKGEGPSEESRNAGEKIDY